MKVKPIICLVVAGLVGTASSVLALSNGDFETADFSGWNMRGKGWSIIEVKDRDGKRSAECAIVTGDEPELRAAIQLIPNADPGKIIEVSLDAAVTVVTKTPASTSYVTVMCTGSDGSVLKEYRKDFVRLKTTFRKMTLDNVVVPPGTVETYLMIVVEISEKAPGNSGWRFDNIQTKIL
jgi:hypothetical protein